MSTPTDPNWTDGGDESGVDGEVSPGSLTRRLALASASEGEPTTFEPEEPTDTDEGADTGRTQR